MYFIIIIVPQAGERTNLQKGTKNKRTTISNDTLILIKSLQNASTHPLSLLFSLPLDVSSAVSIPLPH